MWWIISSNTNSQFVSFLENTQCGRFKPSFKHHGRDSIKVPLAVGLLMCQLILPLGWWKMPLDLSFRTRLNGTFSLYLFCLLNDLFHSFYVLIPIIPCSQTHTHCANNVNFSLRLLFVSVELWVDADFVHFINYNIKTFFNIIFLYFSDMAKAKLFCVLLSVMSEYFFLKPAHG